MARKRRRSKTQRRVVRDVSYITNNRPLLPARPIMVLPPRRLEPIGDDLRTWRPPLERETVATNFSGGQAPAKRVTGRKFQKIGFDMPPTVNICRRRKQRREVLFARGKTGAGRRSRRRYNRWSGFKC